jgi:hypothetical protein
MFRFRAMPWLLAGCLAVAGCGGNLVTKENCNKIRSGMALAEVEQILGKPNHSYQDVVTWIGSRSEQRIVIVLDEQRRVSDKTCEGL